MQRDLLKARFGKLPELPPLDDDDEGPEEEDEERDSFPSSSSQLPPPRIRPSAGKQRDYSPLTAQGCFSDALEVDVLLPSSASSTPTTATFRVYYTPPSPHFSSPSPASSSAPSLAPDPLSGAPATAPWLASPPKLSTRRSGGKGVVFVCVHGAGYSGLSFACFAKEVVAKGEGQVGVLAYDARGHGKTSFVGDGASDMSLESMAQDLVLLLKTMFPVREDAPSILLIGHSMGGAVATAACPLVQKEVADVAGLTVIDVVEGSALDALQGMTSLIAAQPKGFDSVEMAIEWHVRTKTLNNLASARISVPPLLIDQSNDPSSSPNFIWRADLAATEPFWSGWFTGLSTKFLECRTAKLLILAGADRLDAPLMIGQMQGKYQLEVFLEVGHCVQEDAPQKTADTLIAFWSRNDRTDILAGVKKVGQV